MDIAIIGGTGKQGMGLALQLARAGHHVVIGSRSAERASSAAARVVDETGGNAAGVLNEEAAGAADVVFVTVPHSAQAETYKSIESRLRPRAIVVDTTNPIAPHVLKDPGEIRTSQESSAAEDAAALLPPGIRLVAGFQSVSARRLQNLGRTLDGDVFLCGDDQQAKELVGSLIEEMPNLRWIDAGGLSMARAVERLTGLLISVNKRYGIKDATVHLHGHETFGRPPQPG